MNRTNLDLALRYRQKLNWCIIPCNTRDKNPIIPWTEYQKKLSEEQEIESWWTEYPDANLAVVVGNHSEIIAVDVDDMEYFRSKGFEMPQTPKALSGGGGEHYIFRYPDENEKRIKNYKEVINQDGKFGEKFSIRCKNQYLILPDSIHPETGKPYKWVEGQDPFSISIAAPPKWILELALTDPREEIFKKYTYSNHGDSLKEFIMELKSRINLTDLLLELGYEGKREGHYSRFVCPFHDGGAHDYHDDQGYDGIELLMKLKGWDFMETLTFLADRAGLEIPTATKQEDLPAKIEKMIEDANTTADIEPILVEINKLSSPRK